MLSSFRNVYCFSRTCYRSFTPVLRVFHDADAVQGLRLLAHARAQDFNLKLSLLVEERPGEDPAPFGSTLR